MANPGADSIDMALAAASLAHNPLAVFSPMVSPGSVPNLRNCFSAAVKSDVGQRVIAEGLEAGNFFSNTARGNLLAGALWGVGQGLIARIGGADAKQANDVVFSEGIVFGDAAVKGMNGDKHGAVQCAMTDVAGIGGSVIGGAIGSVLIPIPGVGAFIGAAAGNYLADWGAEALLARNPGLVDHTERAYDATAAFTRSAVNTTYAAVSDAASGLTSLVTSPFTGLKDRVFSSVTGHSFG